jgi:hypothetical protein
VGLALSSKVPNKKEDYLELLTMQYQVFQTAKTKGMLSLETHVDNPHHKFIFKPFQYFTASAARRALQKAGLPSKCTAKVVAKAATELRFKDRPLSPGNRRLEIILLRDIKDPNAKSPVPPPIFGNN